MKPYLESGAVEEFVLWNPVDLGYLAVHVASLRSRETCPREGGHDRSGRLGKVEMIADDEVLLGPPLVFNKQNIDKYNF
jgi:rhamnose transport system substrate-binding protein